MSEPTGEPTPTPAQEAEPKVDDIDWKAKAREWEKRAKENKSAKDELDAIRESQKSETEKQSERLAQAERDAQAARTEALRLRVATKHGISEEDADLFLTGQDEETLTRQAKRLSDREVDRKKHGNHVPREGTTPKSADSDERAFVRGLFGGNNNP